MGTPRSSFLHRSASVPPTRVMGAEKAMPSMARQTIRVPMFCATAQGMMKTTASRSVDPLPGELAYNNCFQMAFRYLLDNASSKHLGQRRKGHGADTKANDKDCDGQKGDLSADVESLSRPNKIRSDDG